MSPICQQTILFNVEPVISELSLKYGLFQPFTERQLAVFSEYFRETLFRIFSLNTLTLEKSDCEYVYIYGNWSPYELALINDSTLDDILTKTILFDMLCHVNRTLYFTARLSATTLILDGY